MSLQTPATTVAWSCTSTSSATRKRVCISIGTPKVLGAPAAAVLTDLAVSTLQGCLAMSETELRDRLVMVAADGAAVLQALHTGLIVRIQEWFGPWAQPMHCICHQVDPCGGVLEGHTLTVVVCYSYVCHSTPCARALAAAHADLGILQHQLVRDVETRWVSHYPPAQRVSEQLLALLLQAVREVAERKGPAQAAALEHQGRLTDLDLACKGSQPNLARL